MGYFKLKAGVGPHQEGGRTYRAKDQYNNIVESDVNLAEELPEKFDEVHGPGPKLRKGERADGVPKDRIPPGPPSATDTALAELANASAVDSPDDAEAMADALEEKAKALRETAATMKKASKAGGRKGAKGAKAAAEEEETDDETTTDDEETAADEDDNLDGKTVAELKQIAADEEVEGTSGMNKADLLKAINKGRKARKG